MTLVNNCPFNHIFRFLSRTSLLFFLSGLIQWGGAKVLVEVQSGPLYRVIGYPFSMSCNVSGFSNPEAWQDFRFSIYKPNRPTREIQIISTDDNNNYAMAVYGVRVTGGGITLERLSVTSVLFHVKSLEEGDEGHTPNSELEYNGTYNAKATLKGNDTLTTSSTGSASFSLSEGDALTLQCLASSNTFQHTHLSVTWYLYGDGEASPRSIISLDRDLTVSLGQGFEGLYQAGLIGLDKLEEATYRLKMARIELSDTGRIYCHAQEWIQDPDRSWYPISHKDAQATTLEVKAIEVAPDQGSGSMVVRMSMLKTTQDQGVYHCRAWSQERDRNGVFTQGSSQESTTEPITITAIESSLPVAMENQKVSVDEGDDLQLACRVSGVMGQLSVTWKYRSASKTTGPFSYVISLSRVGVMEPGAELGQRNVRTLRPTADTFTLELSEVKPSDAGAYQCTVSEWTTETNGNAKKTSSQSQDCIVEVQPVESLLRVDLKSRGIEVTEGCEVELVCQVRGPSLPVTVTWSQQREGGSAPDNILTLLHTGDIMWRGDQTSRREAGRYQCVISAFLQGRHRKPQNSNLLAVLVQTPEGVLTLSSSPSSLDQSINAVIQMECSVVKATSNSSRFTVTWLAQKKGVGNQTVLSSDRDAVITLGAELGTEQRISMRRRERWSFELTIRQARSWDRGRYYCVVEECLQDPHGVWYKLLSSSAAMELRLQETVSDLSVNKTDLDMEVRDGKRVELTCTLTSGDPASLYALYMGRGSCSCSSHRVPLDQKGIFSGNTHGTFLLGLQGARQDDSGVYQCHVDQYKYSHDGNWECSASDQSGRTNLTVRRPIVILIFIPLVCILAIVIMMLSIKLKGQGSAGNKKQANSLWAEENPLKPCPEE
ncbi:immunoglobulin superfamily member 2-like [Salmo salar]|uniref:immunoglobulin superfamily member 2-like n=1 Tax=Salmo salar TaxID=8030 RepID=UPI001E66C944|nr:immunoglobulin superfamily member 2-like [Salmo salar]